MADEKTVKKTEKFIVTVGIEVEVEATSPAEAITLGSLVVATDFSAGTIVNTATVIESVPGEESRTLQRTYTLRDNVRDALRGDVTKPNSADFIKVL